MTRRRTHIEVSFKQEGSEITAWYAATPDLVRAAEVWLGGQATTASAETLCDWLEENGAKLDRASGPASVASNGCGYRIERWYSNGKLDRADGPAIVKHYADGSTEAGYYKDGKFKNSYRLAPLSAIRGVKLHGLPGKPHWRPEH
jgi:hypothetical protein